MVAVIGQTESYIRNGKEFRDHLAWCQIRALKPNDIKSWAWPGFSGMRPQLYTGLLHTLVLPPLWPVVHPLTEHMTNFKSEYSLANFILSRTMIN